MYAITNRMQQLDIGSIDMRNTTTIYIYINNLKYDNTLFMYTIKYVYVKLGEVLFILIRRNLFASFIVVLTIA